jgi:hypothetical protein
MVEGLDVFREHFRDYSDYYVLIGGTACDLLMNEAGIDFRATKDLDMVLCVEALDEKFGRVFWDFIRAGGYQTKQSAEGRSRFYRFVQPQSTARRYPFMVELFSRKPDVLAVPDGFHLTPIPLGDELSSLSAILLDDDYYNFICSGKKDIADVMILDAEHLIPLKATAFLNLTRQGAEKRATSKHKNDVFRLYQIINPEIKTQLPASIRKDMEDFLDAMESDTVDLKNLGFRNKKKDEIIRELRGIYGLD